ncbi:MAG: OB-fold nucleic acid binding domain-containing protein [Actinomycetota bacterium]|nr:OB-fold nucleic acid binding domain-containing protein [Actinomycetota bacterium]
MGLRRRLRTLSASVDDLDHERLSTRFRAVEPGHTELGDCPERCRVRVAGEVTSLRLVSRSGSASLEATVDDGTGRVRAVFTGRRAIRGLDPGRGVVLEGVARRERGRLTLVNPAYTLLP